MFGFYEIDEMRFKFVFVGLFIAAVSGQNGNNSLELNEFEKHYL